MRTVFKCLVIFLLLPGCSKFDNRLNNDEELEALIAQEVQVSLSENMGLVALAETGGFQWSHLLVLAPYSPLAEIGAQLGVGLSSLRHFDIDQRDDISLMVFLDGKIPVRAVAFPRSAGDFAEVEPVLIPREMAIFQIEALPNGRVKMRLVGW